MSLVVKFDSTKFYSVITPNAMSWHQTVSHQILPRGFKIRLHQILCCVPISMTPTSVSPNSVVHQFMLSNSKFCSIARNSETANSALNLIDGQQNLSARTQNCKSNSFKSCTLLITTPSPTPSLVKTSLKVDGFSCWQEN